MTRLTQSRSFLRRLRIAVRFLALGWLLVFGAAFVLGALASPAAADNCSTFADCFNQSGAASEAALGLTVLAALSLIVDFIGGRAAVGAGSGLFGLGAVSGWERALGMLGPSPTTDVLKLLGLNQADSTTGVDGDGSGVFGAMFNQIAGLELLDQAAELDRWARQTLGDGSTRAADAANHFFGADVFNQDGWNDFLTTVAKSGMEIYSLNPSSAQHWQMMMSDPDEMRRRYESFGLGLWDGAKGLATFAHSASSLVAGTPSYAYELRRWSETGEHRGFVLVDGLTQVSGQLSSLNPSSPAFHTELNEVWETKSIANHDGLQTAGAIFVSIIDWETFAQDPSRWAGRMTAEGIAEVATGAIPIGLSDNAGRAAVEAAEAAADLNKADNFVRSAPEPPKLPEAPSRTQAAETGQGGLNPDRRPPDGSEGNYLSRGDDRPYSPEGKTPELTKSHIDPETGNLIPAAPEGATTIHQHIRGGEPVKSNSPFTSFTPDGRLADGYGRYTIKVDLSRLEADISAGRVEDIRIVRPEEIQQHLSARVDAAQLRHDANPTRNNLKRLVDAKRDLGNASRDEEFLIEGIVPSEYLTVTP